MSALQIMIDEMKMPLDERSEVYQFLKQFKTKNMQIEPGTGRDPNQKPKLCAQIFDNHSVIMKKDSFEHLLNCLANQKFNPDEDTQAFIDDFWNQGMQLLNPKSQNPF